MHAFCCNCLDDFYHWKWLTKDFNIHEYAGFCATELDNFETFCTTADNQFFGKSFK